MERTLSDSKGLLRHRDYYQACVAQARRGRSGHSYLLDNNTWLHVDDDSRARIRFHNTDIITIWPDNRIVLANEGYFTATTKERMSSYLPSAWNIEQEKGCWFVTYRPEKAGPLKGYGAGRRVCIFEDGVTLLPGGRTRGGKPLGSEKIVEIKRKKVREYARLFIEALFAGQVSVKRAGDCFFCASGHSGDCVENHVRERYYVGSLLDNAVMSGSFAPITGHYMFLLRTEEGLHHPERESWLTSSSANLARECLEKTLTNYIYRIMKLGAPRITSLRRS